MGYTKKWIPPLILRNNLSSWKAQIEDIETNLLEAGLTRVTTVPGQLDLDSVTVHPLSNVDVGFRLYALNDALHNIAPIFIRLNFGGILQGLHTSQLGPGPFLSVECLVSNSFNAAGVLNTPIGAFKYPQRYHNPTNNATLDPNIEGISYICKNDIYGFFWFRSRSWIPSWRFNSGRNRRLYWEFFGYIDSKNYQ